MTELSWEKSSSDVQKAKSGIQIQFIISGLILLGAIAYLIFTATSSGTQFFLTVEEIVNNPAYRGQTVRISGAVLGDTIQYDSQTLTLDFTIVHIPSEFENLTEALHLAVTNPNAIHLQIHMENEVLPDLLQQEAQAIVTGSLAANGIFYADELLLKCPSRYEEAIPGQSIEEGH